MHTVEFINEHADSYSLISPALKDYTFVNVEVIDSATGLCKAYYTPNHIAELREHVAQKNNAKSLEDIKGRTEGYYLGVKDKDYAKWGYYDGYEYNLERHKEKAKKEKEENRIWWNSLTPSEQKDYIASRNSSNMLKKYKEF